MIFVCLFIFLKVLNKNEKLMENSEKSLLISFLTKQLLMSSFTFYLSCHWLNWRSCVNRTYAGALITWTNFIKASSKNRKYEAFRFSLRICICREMCNNVSDEHWWSVWNGRKHLHQPVSPWNRRLWASGCQVWNKTAQSLRWNLRRLFKVRTRLSKNLGADLYKHRR